MAPDLRRRFWVELALAVATASLMLVTLAWRNWIEILFGIDPDGGNGSAEWLIVAGCFGLTIMFLLASRREWRRVPAAAG
jgi:hypothetical protein